MLTHDETVIAVGDEKGLLQVARAFEVIDHVTSHSGVGEDQPAGGPSIDFFDSDGCPLTLVVTANGGLAFERSGPDGDLKALRARVDAALAERVRFARGLGAELTFSKPQDWSQYVGALVVLFRDEVGFEPPLDAPRTHSSGWFHNLVVHRGKPVAP